MPKRTNAFQQVVAILHEHLSGSPEVEESAMLIHRVTGEPREVDVVIRSTIAGYEMVLSVEATMQKGSSPWVESMIQKHAELATNRLVLYSEKGFSRPARRLAESRGVATVEPAHLTDVDPVFTIVHRLESVWPKGVELTPTSLWLRALRPDQTFVRFTDVPLDVQFFTVDREPLLTPLEHLRDTLINDFARVADMLGLADIAEDRDEFFVFHVGEPFRPWFLNHRSALTPVYAVWESDEGAKEQHLVYEIEVAGRAVINVAEVRLTHRRFDDRYAAYGTTTLGRREALLVVSETESEAKMSIRLGPEVATDQQTSDTLAGGYRASDADQSDAVV